MSMQSEKLRSCPFCGGKASIRKREHKYLGQNEFGTKRKVLAFYVKCNRCHARGGLYTTEANDNEDKTGADGAVKNWNMRSV